MRSGHTSLHLPTGSYTLQNTANWERNCGGSHDKRVQLRFLFDNHPVLEASEWR